jgi:hypothetical protein
MNRNLVTFVVIASILDAILTDVGLRHQLIVEANPIMRYLYENVYWSYYSVKILLPISLFFLIAKVGKQVLVSNLFRLAAVIYAGILIMHIYWITASAGATA